MKKRLFFSALMTIFAFNSFSQGMNFEKGNWEEVQKKAKSTGKHIFVDGYTTWCGPCKWMSKNVFPNDTAGQFFNKNFINYKLDMEKGEGVVFAQKYEVQSYPSYIFFDSNGNQVHRSGGSKPVAMFIKDGENALNPAKQLFSLEAKYKAGEKNPQLLKDYGWALIDANKTSNEVASDYIAMADKNELNKKEGYEFIMFLSEPGSKGFNYIIQNRDQYVKVIGEKDLENDIVEGLREHAKLAGLKEDKAMLEEALIMAKNLNPKNIDEVNSLLNMNYYLRAKDFNQAFIYIEQRAEKFKSEDQNELNSLAWLVFENTEDQQMTAKATNWAKKSVDLDQNYANTDTYAQLLFKSGKYAEAKKWAETSVNLSKKAGEKPDETTLQLIKNAEQKLK